MKERRRFQQRTSVIDEYGARLF